MNKKFTVSVILAVVVICGVIIIASLRAEKNGKNTDSENQMEASVEEVPSDSTDGRVIEPAASLDSGDENVEKAEDEVTANDAQDEAVNEADFQSIRKEYEQYIDDDGTVDLPEDVTEIPAGAFSEQSGVSIITIPATVTNIGDYAFSGAGVKSVTIPAGTTEIGDNAFKDAVKLEKIEVEPGNTAFKSENGILYSADGKTLVAVPPAMEEVTVPEEVTNIVEGAISGNTETVYGYLDSAAEMYAMLNGIIFINVAVE